MEHTMDGNITHSGIVDSISGEMVKVRITQSSACNTCKVASYCSSSESKEKIIDVRCDNASRFKVGQKVTVCTDTANGAKAVILAFAIPAVILMATIACCIYAGLSEALSALAGIAILVPYYLAIYLMNDTLKRELSFTIKPER